MNPDRLYSLNTQLVFGYPTRHRTNGVVDTNRGLVVFFVVLVALFAAWVVGVVKLFQKGRRTLGFVAVAGVLIPIVALVGFAGWFVEPVDQ